MFGVQVQQAQQKAKTPQKKPLNPAQVAQGALGMTCHILAVVPKDPYGILGSVFEITQIIYQQVEFVQANKEQFRTLAKRIALMENMIRGLTEIPNSRQYHEGLAVFKACIEECATFIQEFSQKRWYQKILFAGTYDEKFNRLNQQLEQVKSDLQLGLHAQQLVDREQDKRDQAKDFQDIMVRADEIKALQNAQMAELQKLEVGEIDRHAILKAQLDSITLRLNELQVKPADSHFELDPRDQVYFYDLAIDKVIKQNIYLGKWHGQSVAIKKIEGMNGHELEMTARDQFIREVQIMGRLRSPYIVLFQGACLEPKRAALVMEYMDRGSLYEVLEKKSLSLTALKKNRIALNMAKGLMYLHSQGIIHRDLSSLHVLLNSQFQAKISSFVLSKVSCKGVHTAIKRSTAYAWMAPEVHSQAQYSIQSDIYAFGVILWELWTEKKPTENLDAILSARRQGKLFELIFKLDNIPTIYAQWIVKCLEVNPLQRPELMEIILLLEKEQQKLEAEDYHRKGEKYENHKDFVKAEKSYELAISYGCSKGYGRLGFWRLTGADNKPINKKQAYEFLLKGAAGGDDRAQYNLAQMLEYGEKEAGIAVDLLKAYDWYQKAAAQGNLGAQARLERIQEKIKACGLIPRPVIAYKK